MRITAVGALLVIAVLLVAILTIRAMTEGAAHKNETSTEGVALQ